MAAGTFQFWPGAHSVIITEIVDYPQKRLFHIFLAGGDLGELERMTPTLEAWSKTKGCVGATLLGRRGWLRTYLMRTGWVASLVMLEKDYGLRGARQ